MDIKAQASAFSPVSGWKQWVGLAVAVIIVFALATKFGVQKKVNSALGA